MTFARFHSSATAPELRLFARQNWLPPALLALLLVATAQFSFLLFHILAELFTVIVSFVLFSIAWNTFRFSRDTFLIFLACGFFWIGVLDLAHALTYKGMGLLPVDEANAATQIWVGTRYFQALLLLASPFAARMAIRPPLLLAAFGVPSILLLASIAAGWFPDAFIEGYGLTRFKLVSEYIIVGLLGLAILVIWRRRNRAGDGALSFLLPAIVLAIGTELAFTYYVDVYGLSNLVGHILKFFAFWAILRVVIIVTLIQPYQQLAASLRAKDDFFASMSHDLRTPLNSILGFADMIRTHTFGPLGHPKYEEYVGNIHASGTLLLGLVNDILDLSKLESGQYRLIRKALHPAAVTNDVLASFTPDLTAKAISVRLECGDEVDGLVADERALVQLLNNLLSNAVKFTPSGGKIAIGWSKAPQGGVVLQVQDSGRGIPADKIGQLANPYMQIDPYTAQQKGTGLGLFIVRRIAELHNAGFRIESELGKGTTVTVVFPATA